MKTIHKIIYNRHPLKGKTLKFEQDYIETNIKWGLKLGDDIFKKIDVKRAVVWLKSEIKKNSNNKKNISLNKLNNILNEAFSDAIKRSKDIKVKNTKNKNFKETELFKTLFTISEKPSISKVIRDKNE